MMGTVCRCVCVCQRPNRVLQRQESREASGAVGCCFIHVRTLSVDRGVAHRHLHTASSSVPIGGWLIGEVTVGNKAEEERRTKWRKAGTHKWEITEKRRRWWGMCGKQEQIHKTFQCEMFNVAEINIRKFLRFPPLLACRRVTAQETLVSLFLPRFSSPHCFHWCQTHLWSSSSASDEMHRCLARSHSQALRLLCVRMCVLYHLQRTTLNNA